MKTFDLDEAAHFLRLHPHTLEAKARAGEIPGAKPGKRWVFIDEDLAAWLRSQYRAQPEAAAQRPVEMQSIIRRPDTAKRRLEKLLSEPSKRRP